MTTRHVGVAATGLVSLLLIVSSACSKSEPAPSGAASSGSGSAAPLASASTSPTPAGDDAGIAAALDRLAQCESHQPSKPALGPDGKLELDSLDGLFCPAEVAWSDLVDKLDDDDVATRPNHERLARTCRARFGHTSAWVRRVAHDCVAEHVDGLSDARAMLEAVFAALPGEKDADVREAMWKLIGALDPTRHGLAPRAVELARTHASDDESLEAALEALLPKSDYQPTSPEALALAVEYAKSGRVGEPAVKLVLASAMPPSEACEVFVAMLASTGKAWASGLEGMTETAGRCAGHSAKAVDAIVARTTSAKTVTDAWQKDASVAMRDHLGELALDAAAKKKLRDALATLSKEQREAYASDMIAQAMEKLR